MSSPRPSNPPGWSLRDLVRAVSRGDAEALDAWFRWDHPQVYRLCFGLLLDAEEAEDAAQEAMLKLIDNMSTWDPERPYRAWRNALVLNLARDRRRRVAARARAEKAAAEGVSARELPAPWDGAACGEVQALLKTALAHLSPREREVFVLRDLQGASTAEVAESMAIGPGTVRSLSALARRRLRRLLGDRLGEVPSEGDRVG